MGTFSLWHWVIVLALVMTTLIPVAKALKRVGLSPWWAILYLIPIVGWFGLWAFAYSRWPNLDAGKAKTASET